MKLKSLQPALYRVKRGQTLLAIAMFFRVPPRVLAAENNLLEEPSEGQILRIPAAGYNLYAVHGGESMSLLCGSRENFEARNRTKHLYVGQIVWI